MAETATIYRFELELSDVERARYESLEVRVARHPSEDEARLVARVLAYCLLYERDLEFGKGLSTVEEPALWRRDAGGAILDWIDVGAPSAERLHRASKVAERVTVVCHKGTEALQREAAKRRIHRAEELTVLVLEPALVQALAASLTRAPHWTVIRTGDDLNVLVNEASVLGTVSSRTLATLA